MSDVTAAGRVHIVGIGDDGVEGMTTQARRLVEDAEVLLGPESCGEMVPAGLRNRLQTAASLDDLVEQIEAAGDRRTVVLASGDPLFYGTARYVCNRLGKDRFEVVPHVSSMQLAFARVKESWEEAFLANLAGQSIERVIDRVRTSETAGLFTSEQWPPAAVARALLDHGIDAFQAYVCENLGSPDERVTQGSLAEIAGDAFSPLNVMILVRKPRAPEPAGAAGRRLFGNPDECFLQSRPKRGLLTPAEIRSLALGELGLEADSVVWDVGAGSGSVGLEAARLARAGYVYAIEMDPDDHALILENARRLGVMNLEAVLGRAPEAWASLPAPHAVYVGGSGRDVAMLVEGAWERLQPGGRLVTACNSIENLAAVHALLRARSADAAYWMVNIARGYEQMDRIRFEAINPVFLIAATKPSA
ncbi:MAG: precorrin-6y C5,15-methyltransferase (decarboxylating) subunit CbiE [Planctomycetota bacterium]|nr:precorrin-6y C5,15-methyltransferase (decarboxylating) subunit CbiE [Planctomycetota bacterium]MDA1200101.1 precorrin-6y C5,15-methyltransferase (decarboxylating) subunit CbiE [Planctomycetota bacterium]